jgi:CCR4-NOT transcriptional regulation complex NOT5 subunit
MNPLDALDPNITDEKWAEFYGDEVTDCVRDDYPISAVRHDDRIESHKWFSDLLLLIFEGYEEPLAYWDLAPKIVRELQEEVKRLREQLNSLREFCHKEDYDIYNWEVKNIEVTA